MGLQMAAPQSKETFDHKEHNTFSLKNYLVEFNINLVSGSNSKAHVQNTVMQCNYSSCNLFIMIMKMMEGTEALKDKDGLWGHSLSQAASICGA